MLLPPSGCSLVDVDSEARFPERAGERCYWLLGMSDLAFRRGEGGLHVYGGHQPAS
jgi:hypothetical protein